MQPMFEPPQGGYEAELLCPKCKGNYLHHGRIEVFEREQDQPKGLHVTVESGTVTTDTSMTGNPSMRRHGFLIYFSCELCQEDSVLRVAQHKGNTHVSFVAQGET